MFRVGDRSASTAQLTDPDVADPRRRHPLLHLFSSEMRVVAAAGKRPHVSDATDMGPVEQQRERLGGERAVPNGAQRSHRALPYGPSSRSTESRFVASIAADYTSSRT